MKRILVISWFYPPVNSSEGLVTFKLLNSSRYQYDVFTQKASNNWSYGKNSGLENKENVRSIFGKSKTIADWQEEAVAFFDDHADEYDCVMTRSMPQESHVVGLKIKRAHPHVKWIASFGDPVKANPYQHIDCTLHSYHGMDNLINRDKPKRFRFAPKRILLSLIWKLRHRYAIRIRKEMASIEDGTMALADAIIFNNESQKKFMAKTPQILEKSYVIHHSFEPSFYPKRDATYHNEKLRFIFSGHLDAIRTAYPLLRALSDLKEDMPDLAQRAEFIFFGEMADSDLAYFVKNGLIDVVKFHKPIPYLQSLAEMQKADWLLHIDGNIGLASDENIFFAAKIADYFGSGSKIFAITMPQGDIVDILKNAGEMVLSYSANEIKQALYRIIYQNVTVTPNAAYIDTFSAKSVAKEFDEKVVAKLYGTNEN